MAVAFSQHLEASPTPGTSGTLTLGTGTASGDLVVLAVSNSGTLNTPTISGLGATWTKIADDGAANYQVWKGVGCSAGQTSISLTYAASATIDVSLTVWSGAAVETINTVFSNGSVSHSTSSVTPSASDRVVVGGWMVGSSFDTWGSYTDTPSAWTQVASIYSGQSREHHSAYISGTTTATSESASTSGSRQYLGYAVVLNPATAPPASPPPHGPRVYARAVTRAAVI